MNITLIIIGSLLVLFVAYLFFGYRKLKNTADVPPSDKIKVLTDKNFQHQLKTGISLVDFWASWCIPCKMMAPVLNDLANDTEGKASICKLDVEKYQQLAGSYSVRSIPTLILFKNGKEIDRFVGVKTKDFLAKQINQHI
jgi:thioredoxin 1